MRRGWFNDSVRHSLAAKGVRTNYMASRRRLLTTQAYAQTDAVRRAKANKGLAEERAAARLATRRAFAEEKLSDERREELEKQQELDKFSRREQERLKMGELDQKIATELNVPVLTVVDSSKQFRASIDRLERADLGNIDEASAKKAIVERIKLERVQAEPNKSKLKFLMRANELVSMSKEARLAETIDTQAKRKTSPVKVAKKAAKKVPRKATRPDFKMASPKKSKKQEKSDKAFMLDLKKQQEANPKIKDTTTGKVTSLKKGKAKAKPKAKKKVNKQLATFIETHKAKV